MTKEDLERIRYELPGIADSLAERLAREGIGMLIETGQSLDDVGEITVAAVMRTPAGRLRFHMGIAREEG